MSVVNQAASLDEIGLEDLVDVVIFRRFTCLILGPIWAAAGFKRWRSYEKNERTPSH